MFIISIKMTKITINYKEKDNNKEFADLYYRLYTDCIKYKNEKKKEVNCNYYYKKYATTNQSS
jgi:hypothetical protein